MALDRRAGRRRRGGRRLRLTRPRCARHPAAAAEELGRHHEARPGRRHPGGGQRVGAQGARRARGRHRGAHGLRRHGQRRPDIQRRAAVAGLDAHPAPRARLLARVRRRGVVLPRAVAGLSAPRGLCTRRRPGCGPVRAGASSGPCAHRVERADDHDDGPRPHRDSALFTGARDGALRSTGLW